MAFERSGRLVLGQRRAGGGESGASASAARLRRTPPDLRMDRRTEFF
jgi:hypothetical protein